MDGLLRGRDGQGGAKHQREASAIWVVASALRSH